MTHTPCMQAHKTSRAAMKHPHATAIDALQHSGPSATIRTSIGRCAYVRVT